jgi:hypothetical protein
MAHSLLKILGFLVGPASWFKLRQADLYNGCPGRTKQPALKLENIPDPFTSFQWRIMPYFSII